MTCQSADPFYNTAVGPGRHTLRQRVGPLSIPETGVRGQFEPLDISVIIPRAVLCVCACVSLGWEGEIVGG